MPVLGIPNVALPIIADVDLLAAAFAENEGYFSQVLN